MSLDQNSYFKILVTDIKQITRFQCAVEVNDTGHLQADLIQGPSGPIHQLLKESHSLRPWDKQHLGLIQQVLEVNLGLVLGPVPHRKFCFMFHYWWVRERRLIMEPDRRELEKVPTFLLVLFFFISHFGWELGF